MMNFNTAKILADGIPLIFPIAHVLLYPYDVCVMKGLKAKR